jgi:hypothetical protein
MIRWFRRGQGGLGTRRGAAGGGGVPARPEGGGGRGHGGEGGRPRPPLQPGPARFAFFGGGAQELRAVRREAPVAFVSTVKHADANINQLYSHT